MKSFFINNIIHLERYNDTAKMEIHCPIGKTKENSFQQFFWKILISMCNFVGFLFQSHIIVDSNLVDEIILLGW